MFFYIKERDILPYEIDRDVGKLDVLDFEVF